MLLKIVSVKDSAAQAFNRPFFVPATALAIRSFKDEVNRVDASNDMNRHPDDFELYELAEFDDATGVVVPLERPVMVARAKDMLNPV